MAEHIVNFGIVLDDDQIREEVAKNITAQVSADILKELDKSPGDLPTKTLLGGYWQQSGKKTIDWRQLVKDAVEEIAEEWKPDIVERAAEMLAESAKRSKKWRESMNAILDE